MPKPSYGVSRKSRVPVSTAEKPSPGTESQPSPVGLNKRHEDSLISFLECHYKWHLAEDGNLYSPHTRHSAA
jgi:hypothetical protein